jgi:zinc D-Ala-D-Ala dipeptidase
MITSRGRALALLAVLLTGVACTGDPAAEDPSQPPQPSTSAPASSVPALPTAATRASSRPARPATSSRVTRPAVTRSASSTAPPVLDQARAVGLVDIRTVVADAVVELRYATSDNFVGVPMYPAGARCLVHESMAPGLRVAADRLRREGLVVVFWDCYRPHAVQVRMFDVVSDPNWVARPGPYATSHEAGRSVDITLAFAATNRQCPPAQRVQRHCLLDMGTDFDNFTSRAHAFAVEGVSAQAQSNRAQLRSAMNSGGITVYSGEWWHFNGPGSGVRRPHLNAPIT